MINAREYTARMVERTVPLSQIKPHPENYNTHPPGQIDQLKDSHQTLGQFEPVILWQRPQYYTQVKGHGYADGVKLTASSSVKAWVLPEDTPPEIVKQIMLASNLHARNSIMDEGKLADLLEEQQTLGLSLLALGSNEDELQTILNRLEDEKPIEFKEYDETIADDLDTELCEQCGKLCLKGKGNA